MERELNMSRSYRYHPICIQEKKDSRAGNRRLRHSKLEDVANGGAFKKFGVGWPCAYYYPWRQAEIDYWRIPRLQNMFSFEEWKQYYYSFSTRK